jgi:hypothetical protein
MSSSDCQPQERYMFKGTYGTHTVSERTTPVEEFSREEIDAFVRQILGLNQEKKLLPSA